MINELMPKIHSFLQYRLKKCLMMMMMFRNIVLKQDLINDKKGLRESARNHLLCPLAWTSHGIYTLFALYVHKQ